MSDLSQPAAAFAAASQGKRKVGGLAGLILSAALLMPTGLAYAQDAGTSPAATAPSAPAAPVTAPEAAPVEAAAQPSSSAPSAPASTPAASDPAAPAPAADANPSVAEPAPAMTGPAPLAPAEPVANQPAVAPNPAIAPAPAEASSPTDLLQQFLAPERRTDLPHNLSPWGMFMAADWVVKSVMIGLAIASLVTWTIWLAKTIEMACARARIRRALAAILSSASLTEASRTLSGRGGPAAFMVRSAEEELRQSMIAFDYAGNDGVKERLGSNLARIEAQAGRRMSKGTGALATIGSTAPFVGLFGTVWGIMNSFIGISEAQTTNLAVVAPGIAEALLATAIGLVAAIPAVVIYNVFARSITGYRQLLTDAATGVERLVSRDLDFAKVPANVRLVG